MMVIHHTRFLKDPLTRSFFPLPSMTMISRWDGYWADWRWNFNFFFETLALWADWNVREMAVENFPLFIDRSFLIDICSIIDTT